MITREHKQELDRLLTKAAENEHLFNDWENSFLDDWMDKIDLDHLEIRISPKQQNIFDRIEEKLRKAGEL